jgi:hypothetical protein
MCLIPPSLYVKSDKLWTLDALASNIAASSHIPHSAPRQEMPTTLPLPEIDTERDNLRSLIKSDTQHEVFCTCLTARAWESVHRMFTPPT